jgi:hypothetical protein
MIPYSENWDARGKFSVRYRSSIQDVDQEIIICIWNTFPNQTLTGRDFRLKLLSLSKLENNDVCRDENISRPSISIPVTVSEARKLTSPFPPFRVCTARWPARGSAELVWDCLWGRCCVRRSCVCCLHVVSENWKEATEMRTR